MKNLKEHIKLHSNIAKVVTVMILFIAYAFIGINCNVFATTIPFSSMLLYEDPDYAGQRSEYHLQFKYNGYWSYVVGDFVVY